MYLAQNPCFLFYLQVCFETLSPRQIFSELCPRSQRLRVNYNCTGLTKIATFKKFQQSSLLWNFMKILSGDRVLGTRELEHSMSERAR